MFKTYKKIKFENYVLLSGIIEGVIFIFANYLQFEFLLQMIKFLQLIILLFITRRFLKIYILLERKNSRTRLYNYFFGILVIVNLVIMLTLAVFLIIQLAIGEQGTFASNKGDSYITLAHCIFSLCSSTVLFFLGLNLKKMIRASLKDVFESGNFDNYIQETILNTSECLIETRRESEEDGEDDAKRNKILDHSCDFTTSDFLQESNSISRLKETDFYFSIRILQINIVTLSFILCDIYQLFYCFTKMQFLEDHFKNEILRAIPVTNLGSVLYFLDNLSIIIPIFTNFIAFYFLIRKSYRLHKQDFKKLENSLCEKDITAFSERSPTNRDIEQYLN